MMQLPQQQASEIRSTVRATLPEKIQREPVLYTVTQFAKVETAFSEASLRSLIFRAEDRHASNSIVQSNGMVEAGALIRHGRKVLIHREKFLAWIAQ